MIVDVVPCFLLLVSIHLPRFTVVWIIFCAASPLTHNIFRIGQPLMHYILWCQSLTRRLDLSRNGLGPTLPHILGRCCTIALRELIVAGNALQARSSNE